MKKILNVLIPVLLFFSCNERSIEGVYVYTIDPYNDNQDWEGIRCMMMGVVTFHKYKVFYNFTSLTSRWANYSIKDKTILVDDITKIYFDIIDENTIKLQNCTYKKIDLDVIKEGIVISDANVHLDLDKNSHVIEKLNKESLVFVYAKIGDWFKVNTIGHIGYIYKDHITYKDQYDKYLESSMAQKKIDQAEASKSKIKTENSSEVISQIDKKEFPNATAESIKPKVDPRAIFGAGGTNEVNSKLPSTTKEDQLKSHNGSDNLELEGWEFSSPININDMVSEKSGKINFKIVVDKSGQIRQSSLLEHNVSNEVLAYYQEVVNKLTFKRNSNHPAPEFSEGKIKFVILVD